jgi:outer membrane protein assembly factor BamB
VILTRRVPVLVLALVTAVGLAACSSSPSPGSATAAAVRACQQGSPAKLPAATGQQPGGIRWAASLGRCGQDFGQSWSPTGLTAPRTWASPAGGRLVVIVNGVVSAYSTASGDRLWRRSVAPAGKAGFAALDATQSLVMVQFRTTTATLSTFLDASTGQLRGRANVAVHGSPFLVGGHVVVTDGGTGLAGYDPVSGTDRWHTTVPDAPSADAEVNDGTIVYLNSEAGREQMPPMRRIDRLDAASGRLLSPITLPKPVAFDLSAEGGNQFSQGLLLLGISSGSAQTVAVDPASGAVKWTYPGDVVAGAGLFTYFDQGASDLYALDPGTGRQVWSLQQQGLNTEGGPETLLAAPGFAAAWSPATADRWVVDGIKPTGTKAWTSPSFPGAMFVANDASTVYVISCRPWPGSAGVCADITLAAVAA